MIPPPTHSHSRRRARLDAPSPEAWAVAAARQVGREASFTPYWFHGLQQAVIRLAPAWLVNRKARVLPAWGTRRMREAGSCKRLAACFCCAVRASAGAHPQAPAADFSSQPNRVQVMSMHQGFRARYYSRMARQQAEEAAAAAGGSEGEEAPKRELRRRK